MGGVVVGGGISVGGLSTGLRVDGGELKKTGRRVPPN